MRDMGGIVAHISREGALFRERLQTGEAREALAAFAELENALADQASASDVNALMISVLTRCLR